MPDIIDKRQIKVFLKDDPSRTNRMGQGATTDMIYNSYRIGAAFRHGGTLRGLSFEEEKSLLPDIIGVSNTSPDWKKATKDYWCDISLPVPANDIDGFGGGLELEVGFMYANQADADKGRKEEDEELIAFNNALNKGQEYIMKYDVRYKVGHLINPANFVAYRYILLHPEVANRVDDLYKTPRILFYIHSQQVENKIKHVALKARKQAYGLFIELIDQPVKTRYVISLLSKEIDAIARKNKETYDLSSDMGRQIALEDLARDKPGRLISVYNDENLIDKAFIEECIKHGYLKRVSNTDTIIYGANTTIGYNLDQAVIYLRDPANATIKQELEAKVTNWQPLVKEEKPKVDVNPEKPVDKVVSKTTENKPNVNK